MAEIVELLVPPGEEEPVTIVVDATKSVSIGEPYAIIHQSDVELENPDIKVWEDTLKMFTIKFKPPSPEVYTLAIKIGEEEISGSPLKLNLSPTKAKEVKLTKRPTGKIKAGEYIELMFDTFDGGRGELTATCKGETIGEVQVDILRQGISTEYKVIFLPPHEDVYTLAVQYSGTYLQGSPYRIDLIPVRPNLVRCSEPIISEDGNEIQVNVCTEGAGNAKLTAKAVGKECGQIPVVIDKKSNINYCLKIKPPQRDRFTLAVLYGNNNVKDSPFSFNTLIPDVSKVVLTEPGVCEVGKTVCFKADTALAGDGSLSAKCSGEKAGSLPINITEDGNYKYQIYFKPEIPNVYTVEITWAGETVKGSPFIFNLLPIVPVRPNLVRCSEPIISEDGNEIQVNVCTEGAGNAKLTAKAVGKECGQIPVVIDKKSDINYCLKIEPPQRDRFTLTVLYGNNNVKDSPFSFNTLIPDVSKVVLTEPGVCEVGKTACFKADTALAGDGSLSAKCSGEKVGSLPINITEDGDYKYQIYFKPEIPDVYTVEITWAGETVKGSPFIFNLLPIVGNLHTPEKAETEEDVWVDVDCSVAGYGPLTAYCKGHNDEKTTPVSIDRYDSKKYRVRFNPSISDVYSLTLFFGNDVIAGGTFEINLLPKTDATMVKHLGTFIPDNRTEPVVLKFDASKAGPGDMRGRVTNTSHAGLVVPTVDLVNQKMKEYQLSFFPDAAGTYNVDVYWSDNTIPGSPINIKIVYASEVQVTSPVDPELLHPIKVGIDTQYAGPGDLTVYCSGEKTGEIETEITQDNDDATKYSVFFHPTKADFYSMKIYFSNIEVMQSPVEVDLRPPEPVNEVCQAVFMDENPIDIDFSVFCDSPIDKPDFDKPDLIIPTELEMMIREPFTLSVSGIDCDASLSVVAFGKNTGEEKISVTPVKEGLFDIYFNPSKADLYTINLLMNGVDIQGSPFIINYKERPKVEVIPTHPVTKPYVIQYVPVVDINDIFAYAIHDDSCTRQILKVKKGRNNAMYLILQAEKTGLHFIHIKYGSKEISGSPFKIEIVPSDPSACKILDVPQRAFLGEEAALRIDTSRAGAGDIHVIATVPVGGKDTYYTYTEESPDIYMIKLIPKVVGRHMLMIKWSGVPVPGSPFPVNVYEITEEEKQAWDAASRVVVLEENKAVFKAKMHHSNGAYFYIGTEKAGRGVLTVKANGPGDARIKVFKWKDTTYRCEVHPMVSGKYTITILWNGKLIPGNPYQLNFTADKTYMINDFDLESEQFFLEQPCEFRIDCGEWEGVLEVLSNPSDAANIAVNQLKCNGNSYSVKIVPQVIGNHEISMKFAGKHVLRSPYHVQFEVAAKVEFPDDVKLKRLSGLNFPIDLSYPSQDEIGNPTTFDSSKVVAYGPGLQGGYIGQEGNFIIKTGGVKEGKLDVSVQGAKGAFKIRLRYHPNDERTVLGRYDPIHNGEYTINILWCNEHVEGSPFLVNIKPQETNK